MKIIISGTLPSMNEIVAESKRHYGSYSKMKSHYTNHVAWTAKAAKLPSIEGLANFEITWFVRNRKKDKDNLMAGQKFIFDGLVSAGLLKNDGWAQIGTIVHRFEVDNKNPRVEVEIA
jgi:Holliday junction resolvase RusA-like endonuclease